MYSMHVLPLEWTDAFRDRLISAVGTTPTASYFPPMKETSRVKKPKKGNSLLWEACCVASRFGSFGCGGFASHHPATVLLL